MAAGPRREGAPLGAHTRIDHGEMHRPLRETVPHARQDVLPRPEVAGWHLVRDVEQRRAVHARQEHALHLTHVVVRSAEVGEQGDDGWHGAVRSSLTVVRHTAARRQAPEAQNNVIAPPLATAVTLRASQMPSSPIVADHHAASGSRNSVYAVLTVSGSKVDLGHTYQPYQTNYN